jgi:uncharacterized membrane protein (Fun14 family)
VTDVSFELFYPLATQLGFGGVIGFVVGYAVRKLLKILAIFVGVIFLFTQYLAWQGFIEIHYNRVYEAAEGLLQNFGGGVTEFSIPAFITANVPLAGSFVVGLGIGLKLGH